MRARAAMVCSFMCLGVLAAAGSVGATALEPVLELDGRGLGIAAAGVGLKGVGEGRRTIVVAIGGPVERAFLYWAGSLRPCEPDPEPDPEAAAPCAAPAEPFADQVLRFEGLLLTGTLIGAEPQPAGPTIHVGYVADVTAVVAARGTGRQTFAIGDGDTAHNLTDLDGAGMLVIYTDPADPVSYRVIVRHGLDFAYGDGSTHGEEEVTDPFTFNHGASKFDRRAKLALFVADGARDRPDRIDVTGNPSRPDLLDASDGEEWDTEVLAIDVRRRVGATSVQVFSEPVGENPDSLLWVTAALRIPLDDPRGCAPAFWIGRGDAWAPTGIVPGQKLGNVFSQSHFFPTLAAATVGQALRFKDGPGPLGAAKALLRAGAAALLNAVHPRVSHPLVPVQVIGRVNEALASRDEGKIRDAASLLEAANAAGCPL